MYKLIDSHCHLDFDAFDTDRSQVLERARTAGVRSIVIPGVSAQHWHRIEQLCNRNENLYPCYGLHPCSVDEHQPEDLNRLSQWLEVHPHVAVGECGLDYRDGQPDRDKQIGYFEAQLDIAQKQCKPVVIHSVRATEQVIQYLKKQPGCAGMIHSYSGSYEQARQLIDLGFYISLGCTVTHDNARRLHETAKKCPLDALLLETDAPDQPGADHKGERNEPAWITEVLETIAELRQAPAEEIATQTSANARRLFGLPE